MYGLEINFLKYRTGHPESHANQVVVEEIRTAPQRPNGFFSEMNNFGRVAFGLLVFIGVAWLAKISLIDPLIKVDDSKPIQAQEQGTQNSNPSVTASPEASPSSASTTIGDLVKSGNQQRFNIPMVEQKGLQTKPEQRLTPKPTTMPSTSPILAPKTTGSGRDKLQANNSEKFITNLNQTYSPFNPEDGRFRVGNKYWIIRQEDKKGMLEVINNLAKSKEGQYSHVVIFNQNNANIINILKGNNVTTYTGSINMSVGIDDNSGKLSSKQLPIHLVNIGSQGSVNNASVLDAQNNVVGIAIPFNVFVEYLTKIQV
jgi:hypothetical protein